MEVYYIQININENHDSDSQVLVFIVVCNRKTKSFFYVQKLPLES